MILHEVVPITNVTCVAYSYAYGGSVPLNLARLHASVAHYCPRQDAYQVKIICASGCEEVAQLVRSITEETRRQTEVTAADFFTWSFLGSICQSRIFALCDCRV